jgi:two-component system sensor histidine kinase/response regulator
LFFRKHQTTLTAIAGLLMITTCQASPPASLFDQLSHARHDTDRVMTYYTISRNYWNSNADSALLMGEKGLALAEKAQFTKGIALSYLTMGVAYGIQALYPEALDCHLKALRISEQLGMEGLTGNNCTNIGIVYMNIKDYTRALSYFRRALAIAGHFPAKEGVAYGFINLGEAFAAAGQLDSAIICSRQALRIGDEIHDSTTLSASLNDLGDYYLRNGQPHLALPCLQRALRIATDTRDNDATASAHNSMARALHDLDQYGQSIQYADMALREARTIHASEYIRTAYHTLYTDYQGLKDFDKALSYRNREISLNDSLYTLEKERQIKGIQATYELEKQQHQLDLISKDRLLKEQQLLRSRIYHWLLIVGITLMAFWTVYLIRSNIRRKEMNKRLQELNAVKNKLLSIIGHDLRSPIATLKGLVDLMRQSVLSPEQIQYFSKQMSDNLEGTSYLLDNLLFWAKSQMEGMQANPTPFNIRPVIEQNSRLMQRRATEKKITLHTDIDDASGQLIVRADEIMIDLVIRNLTENALKFSRAGDIVTITATRGQAAISITVRDTGQGIPPEDQQKIFRSITYTTTGTSREKGSGLGLSLCKELLEKNGGRIDFVSQPGKGTAFTFTLPSPASL